MRPRYMADKWIKARNNWKKENPRKVKKTQKPRKKSKKSKKKKIYREKRVWLFSLFIPWACCASIKRVECLSILITVIINRDDTPVSLLGSLLVLSRVGKGFHLVSLTPHDNTPSQFPFGFLSWWRNWGWAGLDRIERDSRGRPSRLWYEPIACCTCSGGGGGIVQQTLMLSLSAWRQPPSPCRVHQLVKCFFFFLASLSISLLSLFLLLDGNVLLL